MYPEEGNKIPDNAVDSVLKEKHFKFNTTSEHELSDIKCEFHNEETTTQYGVLENQLYKEHVDKLQFFDCEFPETIQRIESTRKDIFSKDDVKIEYEEVEIEMTEKNELNTSLDYELSNIKFGSEFPDSFQKTEPTISNRFSKKDVKIEYGEIQRQNNEKIEELNSSSDYGLSNIKCEFDEEETKIQFGVLEDEFHKAECSTNNPTLDSELSANLQKTESTISSNNKSHICEICSQCFSRKDCLDKHMRLHIRDKLFKCEICSKHISRKKNLNRHMKIHTGQKPFICVTCSQCFTQKAGLNKHMRTHTGEKPFKCETCSQCFHCKEYLNRHIRIHTGENPFKCETCNKCFNCKSDLNRHMTIHTGEKLFKCNTCGRCFSMKQSLKVHNRIHTGEKTGICEICGKSFSHKISLTKHMKVHTRQKPFKCETCNQCFSLKGYLNKHMRIHTDEKPFKCEICSQCFSFVGYLNKHMRIHTGEKPYKCKICGRCFSRSVALMRHMKIHTGLYM